MKKKWMICAAVLMLILLLFLHLVPMRPFGKNDVIVIAKVEQNVWFDIEGEKIESVDITDQIDIDKLIFYLQIMQTDRLPSHMDSYWMGDVIYEIHGICNGKPLHINIGIEEESQVYESGDKGGYRIKNPEVWLQLIELIRQ